MDQGTPIEMFRKDGSVYATTWIDSSDAEVVSRHRWKVDVGGYATRYAKPNGKHGKGETIRLHRMLMGLAKGDPMEVDHIDRDKLNNRRENLRVVTRAQNAQNLPIRAGRRFRCVRQIHNGRWNAYGRLNGTRHHIGYFDTEEAAGLAAAAFRKEHMPYSRN